MIIPSPDFNPNSLANEPLLPPIQSACNRLSSRGLAFANSPEVVANGMRTFSHLFAILPYPLFLARACPTRCAVCSGCMSQNDLMNYLCFYLSSFKLCFWIRRFLAFANFQFPSKFFYWNTERKMAAAGEKYAFRGISEILVLAYILRSLFPQFFLCLQAGAVHTSSSHCQAL